MGVLKTSIAAATPPEGVHGADWTGLGRRLGGVRVGMSEDSMACYVAQWPSLYLLDGKLMLEWDGQLELKVMSRGGFFDREDSIVLAVSFYIMHTRAFCHHCYSPTRP
jgi:hypothetical protein